MNLSPEELARFESKYDQNSSGCWVWNGPLDRDGYGTFFLRKRSRKAHRVGWFAYLGDIATGYVINHKCRNRACVNHQHLDQITVRENALTDSNSIAAVNARKTHCKKGHLFDRLYGGQRYCSICDAAKSKRLKEKWRAEASQTAC